jgi:hypothetical protein
MDVNVVSEILKPYDALTMRCYPVSPRLNHVVWDVNVWPDKRLTETTKPILTRSFCSVCVQMVCPILSI